MPNLYLLLAIFSASTQPAVAYSQVLNLRPVLESCQSGAESRIAIRRFTKNGDQSLVLVNPSTLDTQQARSKDWRCKIIGFNDILGTRYGDLLNRSSSPPYTLQNDGIRHSTRGLEGVYLTVDLCPSTRKGFNEEIFTSLMDYSKGTTVPVGVSISGYWISNHPQEFNWLREQDLSGKLRVTWVNHTRTHPYNHNLPINKNFLLEPQANIRSEILGLEVQLLSVGITPSVFFRFPGLVSNEKLIGVLKSYSLISVGSDAWLAKGEVPTHGNIILIHGNENEPVGVVDFMRWIKKYRGDFLGLEDL